LRRHGFALSLQAGAMVVRPRRSRNATGDTRCTMQKVDFVIESWKDLQTGSRSTCRCGICPDPSWGELR
jgi:hypothetical protein